MLTEFLQPVGHAGPFNTISCAFGLHVAEGRWLRDKDLIDEYARFWFHSGPNGGPATHFHKYSSWAAAALYDRYLVTKDRAFLVGLLDDLIADYKVWETERMGPDGLFWQFDVRDGMEESISGSRRQKNVRPTINSYMVANAQAISQDRSDGRASGSGEGVCREGGDAAGENDRGDVGRRTRSFSKCDWRMEALSDAREEIGFIPWMFKLAGPEQAEAWQQLKDPKGFWAPAGITTAERRHPKFRSHGTGTCEWDGAVWPFATSQTLVGLANLLRGPKQDFVSRRDYFDALLQYARYQQMDGKPYIGEYFDENSGKWLITGPKAERSRYYNHSTFADLVIGGLVGIVPHEDDTIEVDPLLPADAWDWFCLDGVPYHGHRLTVIWDRNGKRYNRGAGLTVSVDGKAVANSATMGRLVATLPTVPD